MKTRANNEVTLAFPSRSSNEGFARAAVSCFAAQMDPTLNELEDIKTAVSEAVTNAIVHAYPDSIGQVVVKVRICPDQVLEVTVRDHGRGIPDMEKARQPMFTTGGEERSGMGFTIMESFMDKLVVRSTPGRGTTVVHAQAAGAPAEERDMSATLELLRAAQEGDRDACERAVIENNGLIWSVVRRYYGRGVDPEDLYQLGCLGFLKAVQGFDFDYGTCFSTYAVPKIAGEIRRFLRDDGAVKVGRSHAGASAVPLHHSGAAAAGAGPGAGALRALRGLRPDAGGDRPGGARHGHAGVPPAGDRRRPHPGGDAGHRRPGGGHGGADRPAGVH